MLTKGSYWVLHKAFDCVLWLSDGNAKKLKENKYDKMYVVALLAGVARPKVYS